jgi:hypothetical protein
MRFLIFCGRGHQTSSNDIERTSTVLVGRSALLYDPSLRMLLPVTRSFQDLQVQQLLENSSLGLVLSVPCTLVDALDRHVDFPEITGS